MTEQFHSFTVYANVPKKLRPLEEMAYNLWFSWNPQAVELFQRLDPDLWNGTRHNPVLLLSRLNPARLAELEQDEAFLSSMELVHREFRRYLEKPYFNNSHEKRPTSLIAYFSAEYGLTDCLPFYHGGLGVLAGDHLKCSSDLNIPMVAIGLLCQFGAYRQILTLDGEQREVMPEIDFHHMPMRLEKLPDGTPVTIQVELKNETAVAQIWRVDVGRVKLYLLDTNIPQNPPHIRDITITLYASDRDVRLRQEILLGIGGMRALNALGLNPVVFHMNEGHSAFAGLERIRQLREEHGISFNVALLLVQASNCFTTHTSVPAGIDLYEPGLIDAYFGNYVHSLGISVSALLGLGRRHPTDRWEPFCMNILAMKLSGQTNGVSRLHQNVSQRLWKDLWPAVPVDDVPIFPVTNGIHVPSWIARDTHSLFDRYLGPHWPEDPDNRKVWSRVAEIPDLELWSIHERRRQRLITFCRSRLQQHLSSQGASSAEISRAREVLDPDTLTLVWAKRMAGYKRPLLIFRDLERLERILKHPTRPVQVIIAGKAHPNDAEAKRAIKEIIAISRDERFRRHVVFVEDYDLEVARFLVEGADVWLNTPRRPNEACGTSGMKAVANAALHVSTLDGWWAEAYTPDVGWLIGTEEEHTDTAYQDEMDGKSLYNLLEHEIAVRFYERGPDGLPYGWIRTMKTSMLQLCPEYSTHRMMQDYVELFYRPAETSFTTLVSNEMSGAKELAEWYERIKEHWPRVAITSLNDDGLGELRVGTRLQLTATIGLGELTPDDVSVEVYYGILKPQGELEHRRLLPMEPVNSQNGPEYEYQATLECEETGKFGYLIRVMPHHPLLMPTHYSKGSLVVWG